MIDLTESLAVIELQLAEVETAAGDSTTAVEDARATECRVGSPAELRPAAGVPRRDVSGNPFDESFEEEELVVDPYAAMQVTIAMQRRETLEVAAAILRERNLAGAGRPAPQEPPLTVPVVDTAAPSSAVASASTAPEALPEYELQPEGEEATPISGIEAHPDWTEREDEKPVESSLEVQAEPATQPFSVADADDFEIYRRVSVVRQPPPDDNDMILIVDDNLQENPPRPTMDKMHRREYRHLFSRLRRS
jgi:hypothetical protein